VVKGPGGGTLGGITIRPCCCAKLQTRRKRNILGKEYSDKWRASILVRQSGAWWFRLEKMVQQLTNEESTCPHESK
jgi:hypothetical protein